MDWTDYEAFISREAARFREVFGEVLKGRRGFDLPAWNKEDQR